MACTNPRHDHLTTTEATTGDLLDAPIPMMCGDCRRPTHYDRISETYEHDDPAAPGCFLIQQRSNRATPCTHR